MHSRPSLEVKWERTGSNSCWLCKKGRKTREHLFKECREWKNETHILWEMVGGLSGEGEGNGASLLMSRKGFGYEGRKVKWMPSNRAIRERPLRQREFPWGRFGINMKHRGRDSQGGSSPWQGIDWLFFLFLLSWAHLFRCLFCLSVI